MTLKNDGMEPKGGKDLPSGTYYYIIELNEKDMSPITGPITIVR